MHFQDPVTQAIHDQLQRTRAEHAQAIACAGVIHVVARILLHQPVVYRVVDAPKAQRRAVVVALGGVVVDHIQDDLDARAVVGFDHFLKFSYLLAELTAGGVLRMRSQEANRIIAPVVG